MIFFSDIIKKKKKCEKGSALYFSLVIMAVILSIVVGLGVILKTQIKTIKDIEFSVPAFYLADAGTEEGLYRIRIGEESSGSFKGNILDFDGEYEVKITTKMEDSTCENDYCLRSVGVYEGVRRAIETSFDTGMPSPPSSPPSELSSAEARDWAKNYCQTYFSDTGTAKLDGVDIYCDASHNMWAPIRPETYMWAEGTEYQNNNVMNYTGGVNDCNEVEPSLMENFPACNACATLEYAGLTGWRLPSSHTSGAGYCPTDNQLWNYGYEFCGPSSSLARPWGEYCSSPGASSCKPSWDDCGVVARTYWSATQFSITSAWHVHFGNAHAAYYYKSDSNFVRCFLGHW